MEDVSYGLCGYSLERSFLEFFDHAGWVLTGEEMDLFGFLAWRIWHHRNLLVHEHAKFDPQYSYLAAVWRFKEYKNVVQSKRRGVKEIHRRWRPPGTEFLTLKAYGAFCARN